MRNDLTIYRTYAPNWWDGSQRFLRVLHNLVPARLKHFDPIIGSWDGKAVVDLGCGGGFMSEALARKGAQVTGVDPSQAAIEAAQDHAQTEGIKINYLVGAGENIPVGDCSVNSVVCVDDLEHVEDVDRVLDEIRRILKPGDCSFRHHEPKPARSSRHRPLWRDRIAVVASGTHDPPKFVRPSELRSKLDARGFHVGPLVGLGPRGINGKLDFTFGKLPSLSIMYAGHASLPPRSS